MEGDNGFVLKGRPLLTDLEPPTVSDQYVLRLQLDVGLVEQQRSS